MILSISTPDGVTGTATRSKLIKHSPSTNSVRAGEGTVHLETSITVKTFQIINTFAQEKNIQVVALYEVPGRKGFYLAIGSGGRESTVTDFGLRLYLLNYSEGRTSLLSITRGMHEAFRVLPVFFSGHGRLIILVSVGEEEPWHIAAFEVRGKSLQDLGDINATLPYKSPFEDTNAIPHSRAFIEGKELYIVFSKDLYLERGLDQHEILKAPATFLLKDGRFSLKRK